MAKNFVTYSIAYCILTAVLFNSCVLHLKPDPEKSKDVFIVDTVKNTPIELDYLASDEPEPIFVAPAQQPEVNRRDSLIKIFRSFLYVREATGKNDGKEVEMFLANEGLKKGFAWCSAYAGFCLDSADIENTVTAWSPTAENKDKILYKNGKDYGEIRGGDSFTIYYPKKKRIGHTGFVDHLEGRLIITNEGNANLKGSREGDGVYSIIRPKQTLHSISSWIND